MAAGTAKKKTNGSHLFIYINYPHTDSYLCEGWGWNRASKNRRYKYSNRLPTSWTGQVLFMRSVVFVFINK